MERLRPLARPAWWWPQCFLALIASLLIGLFFVPVARAADDTFSVSGGKITIQSEAFYGGSYTEGATDVKVQCSLNSSVGAKVTINQDDKTKIENGETVDSISYTINPDSDAGGGCPEGERTAQSSGDSGTSSEDGLSNDSCAIEGFGWFICSPSMWIANGMDTIYGWLEGFLETQPLETTNTGSMVFQAWDIMRGFANAVFIVAFLLIIYSQITSMGINNYGIKKLAPRLIVAAILVNLSYYICSLAIDLSNILGSATKDMFDGILQSLFANSTPGATDTTTNKNADIIQAVLSGGALTVGGLSLVGGSLLAASPFILPLLLSLFISALIALLVLSARQAIMIIIVIISPLAFVLYLLPGTEKWFEKWRNLFFTMLVFFPAFAVVFGGANLAGIIISETAGSSVVRFILGWAVQLAPLAITPLIMKLGGGLLNRFAGIVNDPTKGFLDKTKQQARDRSQDIINRRTYGNSKLQKGWRRYSPRGIAHNNRLREQLSKDKLAESEKMAENAYKSWSGAKRQDIRTRQTNDQGSLLEQRAENRYEEMRAGYPPSDIRNRNARDKQQASQQASEIRDLYTQTAAEGLRKTNAQRALSTQFSDDMLASDELQKQAGGNIYKEGKSAAVALAVNMRRQDMAKTIEEGHQILKHFNLSASERQSHAIGKSVTGTDREGHTYSFDNFSSLTREAAIESQLETGTPREVAEIIAEAPPEFYTTVASSLVKSGMKNKAPFLGGKLIDDIGKGAINSRADLTKYIGEWIRDNKYKEQDIASTDVYGIELLTESINSMGSQLDSQSRARFKSAIDRTLNDKELSRLMAENTKDSYGKLKNLL